MPHDPALVAETQAWLEKLRYPGDPDRPSQQEAGEALAIARGVYDAVVQRLPGIVRR